MTLLFFLMILRQQISTLFPYTTLFRSLIYSLVRQFTKRSVKSLINNTYPSDCNGILYAIGSNSPRLTSIPRVTASTIFGENSGSLKTQTTSPLRTCLRIRDRKSTRLNSSHVRISYAVFCLKKKKKNKKK